MKITKILRHAYEGRQSGAALVTVLFISLLLLTASVAMLTAVGSNSRNTTDVLSETKAYYAAETGIQSAVNVLRNAVPPSASPSATPYSYSSFIGNLSTWLGSGPIAIGTGTGTSYSINVTDPDNTAVAGSINYHSSGKFLAPTPQIVGQSIWIPGTPGPSPSGTGTPDTTPRTMISIGTGFGPAPSPSPNTKIAEFEVFTENGGADAFSGVKFRIDYVLTAPRNGVASIYGTITKASGLPITVTFQSRDYRLLGSTMQLCTEPASGCGITTLTLSSGINPATHLYMSSSTAFSPEPYRLKLVSTGYGPNGAKKTLEAIVRRNLFDGYDPPGLMLLVGQDADPTGTPFHFDMAHGALPGTGCPAFCIPSFGVAALNPSNQNPSPAENNLQTIRDNIYPTNGPSPNVTPGPQIIEWNNLPSWLQSPTALDGVIRSLRTGAQHSGRYQQTAIDYPNDNSYYNTGTGITFCEGNCTLNEDGGGVLIVTGGLTYNGGVSFRGLILVVGKNGWNRNGGGNGQITGNIIIAPYNLSLSTTTFLAPRYDMGGGGSSGVTASDINPFIDTTLAVSDFIVGVAEK